MNINHERLVPGAITYWGDVVGDITDQQDLVDYVASHGGGGGGGGNATWGSIQGTLSNQSDLNDRLTGIDSQISSVASIAQDASDLASAAASQASSAYSLASSADSMATAAASQADTATQIAVSTSNALNDEKELTTVRFAAANSRITALEQNPGVSQQAFANHINSNDSDFYALDQSVSGLDRRVTALEQGGGSASWGSITGYLEDQTDLNDRFTGIDYFIGQIDNELGGRIDVLDENAVKIIWSEDLDLDDQILDRPNYTMDDGYYSEPYILGLYESFAQKEVDGDTINTKLDIYTYIDGGNLLKKEKHFLDDGDGGWNLETELEFDPAWIGSGWDVLRVHDIYGDPNFELPENYPMYTSYYEVEPEWPWGFLDESTLEFNGFKMDENYNLGKYKIEGVEDGSEITYEETFIPYIAAEEPDTSTDATYVLKATVQDGEVTYSWVPDNVL